MFHEVFYSCYGVLISNLNVNHIFSLITLPFAYFEGTPMDAQIMKFHWHVAKVGINTDCN